MVKRSKIVAAFVMAVACLTIQACSSVYQTSTLPESAESPSCVGNAGAYSLPRAELKFAILKTGKEGDFQYSYEMKSGTAEKMVDGPSLVFVPDGSEHCINFLANPFYSDVVRVKQTDGLLEKVYSNTQDQSKDIAEKVAEAVALKIADNRGVNRSFNGTKDKTVDTMQVQIDPFDLNLLTQTNVGMRDLGYCMYIDPTNDPYVPGWMGDQCQFGRRSVSLPASLADDLPVSIKRARNDKRVLGIFYKPLLTHSLVILRKSDPTSAEPWKVWRRQIINMPNRAPVFVLEVKRGFFTQRKTEITFNNGLLLSVKVDKKSEIDAISDSVMKIAAIAVQIPAKALILRQTEIENRAQIIKINQQLLQAYASLDAVRERRKLLKQGIDPDAVETPADTTSRSADRSFKMEACIQNAELGNDADPEGRCQNVIDSDDGLDTRE